MELSSKFATLLRTHTPRTTRQLQVINMSKTSYEAPVTKVIVVNIESGLLTASTQGVQGYRSSYGTAESDSWD